ncbi:glycosyltransferase family 2 protein [Cycloclasticus zancles]|jgi:N-acetylglucosaminyl-diphospho-decaprenol L-rhamnosyltransferase|uniref:glycosyltransferase family 2 protein n=1 Tax=Cycloclasticus zancles TaxID=1329899 RepID=UPI00040DC1A5|nr:glycosyltransferase family 2 protein [Cycloclasticus zancles]KXJ58355.1 MAG: family 2 glycosyl transferase [Colwellia sp. Phe_37]
MRKNIYKLSVVIVNYRTPQLTIDCLISLIPELEGVDAKIVVVDNASNDGSCKKIQNWIDQESVSELIDLLSSPDNTGFSGGNNLGIKHVEAEYFLLLNSDTLVRKNAIATLLGVADKDESAGLISPRLEWPDTTPQESCFKFHTAMSELISSASTGAITKLLQSFVVAQTIRNEKNYYDWASFACILIKAEVFHDIGLLDDGYFMYYEDVDFCFRAKKKGWKILNTPSAKVVHLRGGSSPVKSQAKLRKRLPRYYYESRTRCFYRLYGFLGLLTANILWTFGWFVSSFRGLLSSSYCPNVSQFQWCDIWTNFFSPERAFIHPDNYDKT